MHRDSEPHKFTFVIFADVEIMAKSGCQKNPAGFAKIPRSVSDPQTRHTCGTSANHQYVETSSGVSVIGQMTSNDWSLTLL